MRAAAFSSRCSRQRHAKRRLAAAAPDKRKIPLQLAGVTLVADADGGLYWPEEGLLAVADLHLEKGSAFAARGVLLPPYDTAATLARLATLIERYLPRLVVALGDSFHDGGGPWRMAATSRSALTALQRKRDWIWIAGNHDPDPADNIGGRFADALALGTLTFRHEPAPRPSSGEIAGHLHPLARVARRGRAVRPALLCRRRRATRHAGLRRLCRRPQCSRPRHRRRFSARCHSPRICSASGGSTPSRPRAAWRIERQVPIELGLVADCDLSRRGLRAGARGFGFAALAAAYPSRPAAS